jgi:zinc transporter ZupT
LRSANNRQADEPDASRRAVVNQPLLTGLVALGFVAVHILGGRLGFLRVVPRSAWLSFAGGVSVAYVFVHLLPELAEHQSTFERGVGRAEGLLAAIEAHVYLMALIGLAAFYGLERLARRSALAAHRAGGERRASDGVFWVHLGAFAVYNLLIGYLLVHRDETDARGLLIYAVALGLHFVVNDQGLREHHGRAYDAKGRWLLAAAPLAGWALGLAITVSLLLLAALFAFLAGGVVLNVLKEELPEDRESRFPAFAAGAAAYAALLLAT